MVGDKASIPARVISDPKGMAPFWTDAMRRYPWRTLKKNSFFSLPLKFL